MIVHLFFMLFERKIGGRIKTDILSAYAILIIGVGRLFNCSVLFFLIVQANLSDVNR